LQQDLHPESSPSPQAPRQRSKQWLWGVIPVVLIVAIIGFEILGWSFLRDPLQRLLSRQLTVGVQMQGDFKARFFWRPFLQLTHLQIGAIPQLKVPYLMQADQVQLSWRWGDIWRWRNGQRLRIKGLEARSFKSYLVRDEQGRATWHLGQRPPEASKNGPDPIPQFDRLIVGQGEMVVRDPLSKINLQIRMRGQEYAAAAPNQPATASGYEAWIEGTYKALPLKLEIKAAGVLPLVQQPAAAESVVWVPVQIQGRVASSDVGLKGRAAALMASPLFEGAFRFNGPSLAEIGAPFGVTLPRTPPFELKGRIHHEAGVWQLGVEQATSGSSRLTGHLQYDARPSIPLLTGEFKGPRIALADLGPAVGAPANAKEQQAQSRAAPGRILPQRRFNLPSLRAMNADVKFHIQELDFGTPSVAPWRSLQARVQLKEGLLTLQDIQAGIAGGQVQGMTQLDGRQKTALWKADLQFKGVNLASWVRGLSKQPPEAKKDTKLAKPTAPSAPAVKAYVTGILAGGLNVRGQGQSTAEILGSMNGRAQFDLRNGTISHLITEALGLDVAQSLGVLLSGDEPLKLQCARMDLMIQKGVVQPKVAVIDNSDSTIWITGQLNLNNESMDLRVVTHPKDLSFLSLRTPITITGSFGQPKVGIEAKNMAGRLLGAVALGAVLSPIAALIPLIDPGDTSVQNPCASKPSSKKPG
jgi:AsmA family protein